MLRCAGAGRLLLWLAVNGLPNCCSGEVIDAHTALESFVSRCVSHDKLAETEIAGKIAESATGSNRLRVTPHGGA